jgi:hypothetical protein
VPLGSRAQKKSLTVVKEPLVVLPSVRALSRVPKEETSVAGHPVVQKRGNGQKVVAKGNRAERGVRRPVVTVIPNSGVRVRNVRAVRQDVRRLSRKRSKPLGHMMFRVPQSGLWSVPCRTVHVRLRVRAVIRGVDTMSASG